jgi:hypothetical protein
LAAFPNRYQCKQLPSGSNRPNHSPTTGKGYIGLGKEKRAKPRQLETSPQAQNWQRYRPLPVQAVPITKQPTEPQSRNPVFFLFISTKQLQAVMTDGKQPDHWKRFYLLRKRKKSRSPTDGNQPQAQNWQRSRPVTSANNSQAQSTARPMETSPTDGNQPDRWKPATGSKLAAFPTVTSASSSQVKPYIFSFHKHKATASSSQPDHRKQAQLIFMY